MKFAVWRWRSFESSFGLGRGLAQFVLPMALNGKIDSLSVSLSMPHSIMGVRNQPLNVSNIMHLNE